jgi:hypothetical protein
MTPPKDHQDMRALASGISLALAAMNDGKALEFMLVVVRPAGPDEVTLNTITMITDPAKVRDIGQHLIDMSQAQIAAALDPDGDDEVQGHA